MENMSERQRKVSTRMKEHRASITKGNEKSAQSTHNLRTGHTFDWDRDVVDTEARSDRQNITGDPCKS